ncbi:ubiquitin fusion degradation protein [Malassezia sp. CBS 17886]|nr:ubiquitin fusion degradation protein [Malassezia sp. CBS 17886]
MSMVRHECVSADRVQFGQIDSPFGTGMGRPRFGGLGEFMMGMDQRFPAPPQAYEDTFKAYSMARFTERERKDVSYGGKADLELESPWTFTLRTSGRAEQRHTHAGVVEFIADEGNMMRMLQLDEGDPIHIQGCRLPKGQFVKLQPQTVDFLEISDPKAVLEQALRHYPTLTPGDIIEISYNCLTFEILIMEVQPDAEGISILETDLEVDFAAPKGYVEPARQPRAPPPTMASKLQIDKGKVDVIRAGSGAAQGTSADPSNSAAGHFKGAGQTLSGKKTKGRKEKPITPKDEASRVRNTEYEIRPVIVTNDTQLVDKHVPTALNVPFGTLFFGYDVKMLDVPVSEPAAEERPADVPDAEQTAAPFSGAGNTLRAPRAPRPPADVIEIDSD